MTWLKGKGQSSASLDRILATHDLLDAVDMGMALLDDQGILLAVNEDASELLGWNADVPLPMEARAAGMVDAVGRPFDFNELPAPTAMRERRPVSKAVIGVDRPGRRRRWLSVSASPIMDAELVLGAIVVYVEITPEIERRHMLELMAEVNLLVTNSHDEDSLLQGLCDLLVERGGYPLAWIGLPADGVEGSLEPRWAAGAVDYLHEGIVSASADSPLGQGPTGTAFRTRTMRIANDFRSDADYEPWRARVRRFELSSAIAVPLDISEPAVLCVYDRHPIAFDEVLGGAMMQIAHAIGVQAALLRSLDQTARALEGTVRALATMTEFRDPYTQGHQERVAQLGEAIAEQLGLDPAVVQMVHLGATVHDIGKVKVPAEILTHPGPLTPLEYELVKEHCRVGAAVLSSASVDQGMVDIALQHHERLDGSGYPNGLVGDQIGLPARIVAVADVVEAMTNHRPYRPSLGLPEALAEIGAGGGTLFDADVVDACMTVFAQGFDFEREVGSSPGA